MPDAQPLIAPFTALLADARTLRDRAAPGSGLVAVGFATVDIERASREGPPVEWHALPRDPLLGASVRRLGAPGVAGRDGSPEVVLLEPDTEGLLAATLARFGEGLGAIYVRAVGRTTPSSGARRVDGPFGGARLLAGPRWGPHVIVLEPAATIER